MNFLKRYYDKVILLVLFLLCIGLMVYVESIHSETREVDASKLNIKRPKLYISDIEMEKEDLAKKIRKKLSKCRTFGEYKELVEELFSM